MRKGFTGRPSIITNALAAHRHLFLLNEKKHIPTDIININEFLGPKETSYRFLENAIPQNHLHTAFSKKLTQTKQGIA